MLLKDVGLNLVQGEQARLIPVGSEKAQERRATSVFLSTLSVVERFAISVLGTVGQKLGARSSLECYTEVVLTQDKDKNDRPDGLIVLRTGKRVWSALIEAKTGTAQLDVDQIQRYLSIAKQHKIDAVITISNQFAALPTHHPVKVPKTATRSVGLFHWSWMSLRTHAIFELDIEQKLDPEQRYILNEFKRYFMHPSSGVKSFDSMNTEWKEVCSTVKNGGRLLKTAEEVRNTIGAWHQEQRDISLLLTRELKVPVSLKLKKTHKAEPESRLKDDSQALVDNHRLTSVFEIPDAASDLTVIADLRRRTVSASMEIIAPTDKKSTKARVNWLIRQLQKTGDSSIQIVAKWPGRTQDTSASLDVLRDEPGALQCENTSLSPTRFQVMLVRDLAGKFSGSKTFLDCLNSAVKDYYREAGEHLRLWVPPAPKLPRASDLGDVATEPVEAKSSRRPIA